MPDDRLQPSTLKSFSTKDVFILLVQTSQRLKQEVVVTELRSAEHSLAVKLNRVSPESGYAAEILYASYQPFNSLSSGVDVEVVRVGCGG